MPSPCDGDTNTNPNNYLKASFRFGQRRHKRAFFPTGRQQITSRLCVHMLRPTSVIDAALQNDLRETTPCHPQRWLAQTGSEVRLYVAILPVVVTPRCGGIGKESPTDGSYVVLANSVALCVTGSCSLEVTDKAGRRLCQTGKQCCALREIRGAI